MILSALEISREKKGKKKKKKKKRDFIDNYFCFV